MLVSISVLGKAAQLITHLELDKNSSDIDRVLSWLIYNIWSRGSCPHCWSIPPSCNKELLNCDVRIAQERGIRGRTWRTPARNIDPESCSGRL